MKALNNKNFLYIIISIVLATILWMVLSNNINPLVHERISVPIEIRIDSELSDAGRSFSLPTENQKVIINYYVRRDDVGKVSVNDITAYVGITYDKEKVYVTVDDMAHKSIKVSYNIKGRLASENLAVAYVSVEPNELFVNGPATEVDKVSKIAFDVDISGKDQNFTGNARPIMYDANGNSILKDLTPASIKEGNKSSPHRSRGLKRYPLSTTLSFSSN